MVGCCAGFAAVLMEANCDDRSVDLFGRLNADVRVTTQTRKRSAADALRILFFTRRESCQRRDLLVEHENRAGCLRGECWLRSLAQWSGGVMEYCFKRRTPNIRLLHWTLDVRCSPRRSPSTAEAGRTLGVFCLLNPES